MIGMQLYPFVPCPALSCPVHCSDSFQVPALITAIFPD